MPVRYDPLLTAALAREIRARWEGARVASLVLDRARRAGELRFEDSSALFAALHPEAGHLLALEAAALTAEGHRFRRLFLSAAEAPADERALQLTLSDAASNPRHRISAELQTNQWNLLLLSPGGDASPGQDGEIAWRIDHVLWRRVIRERRLEPGAPYDAPANPRRGAGTRPDEEVWMESLAPIEPAGRRGAAIREWAYLSAVNIDRVLGTAAIEVGEEALREAFSRYEGLLDECSAGGAWLLERSLGPQPYPSSLGEPGAAAMPSLFDAMQASAEAAGGVESLLALGAPGGREAEPDGEVARLRAALAKRAKRIERRLAALERERDGAGPRRSLG